MNTKTGLWAFGLFAVSSVVMINCGGDSDGGNSNTGGASAGNSTAAGMSSTAGKGGNGSSGSSNTAGNTASGGDGPGPGTDGGAGTDIPGFGGDGNVPACPDDPQGKMCTPGGDTPAVCYSGGQGCFCQAQGATGTWVCLTPGGGDGGAGSTPDPGDLMVDCGDNPMTGDTCSAVGICIGS